MMTLESSHSHKDLDHDLDVRELFNLLDSTNIADVNEIKELVEEKLLQNRDTWILNSLVEYFYITSSKEAIDILINVKEPHDKHLVDKITDGIKSSHFKLKAVQLLLHVVCKQPTWIQKLGTQSVFGALMKCLKNETDVPILMTGVMSLTVLFPTIPTFLGNHLSTVFEVFTHLVAFSYKKPGNVPDVYMLHLQVALYSLFHRIYGMFPYNFIGYLRLYYSKKDNVPVYDEVVKPMLERVRLHPGLITASRDAELSNTRWKSMETQDVVMECAKMSLDVMEGMFEDASAQNNIFNRPLQNTGQNENRVLALPETMPFTGYQQQDTFFSPSLAIGMSTPPPSQRNTPATSVLETSSSAFIHSATGTYGNTPVLTPRETTPIFDETEKGMSRNSSKGSLFTNRGSDKRSITIVTKSSVETTKSSVPPSPLKTEFTAEPPFGTFKSQPMKNTARELKFDMVPESPLPSFSDGMMFSGESKAEEDKEEEVPPQNSSEDRPDLMSSFSMDTLPKMMEDLHNSDEDDEVSEINENHQIHSSSNITAESVAQFMKSVNRIRFNSLTATNTMDIYKQEKNKATRSRSCPSLPKLASMDDEDESENSGEMSRSVSMATDITQQAPTSSQISENLPETSIVTMETSGGTMTTSQISNVSCPAFTRTDSAHSSQSSFIDQIRKSLLPNSLHLCQKCKSNMISDKPEDKDVPLFQTLSPLELLDKHLTMGREIHAKELSKIPITSQESINWTHFGGAPPADEINILRGQIIMMENQLMYERHKRELHNKKNRRLLRKIANAETLEANNNVMAEQISILETEIQNFKITTKLLQEENRKLKDLQESNEYETQVKLRTALQENSDLKSIKTELNTLLVRQREEQDALKKKLQESENKLFHRQQEILHLKEQEELAQKLKDQILNTHRELMLMGELQQKYKESINISKYRNNRDAEHDMLVATLKAEKKVLQAQFDRDALQLTACQQKIIEQEETLKNKDVCIIELKKRLEDVKVSQEDALKASDDKYQSLVKINQALEGNMLKLYSQIDQLKQPRHKRVPDTPQPVVPQSPSISTVTNLENQLPYSPVMGAVSMETTNTVNHVQAVEVHGEALGQNHNRDPDESSLVSKESGIEP